MIESDLRTLLVADSTISTTYSAVVQAHIGQDLAIDQNYILYTVVSNTAFDQLLSGSSGQWEKRIQFDCWSTSPLVSRALAERVTALLHRFSGATANHTVQGCFHDSERDTTDRPIAGRDVVLHGVQVDFKVIYY